MLFSFRKCIFQCIHMRPTLRTLLFLVLFALLLLRSKSNNSSCQNAKCSSNHTLKYVEAHITFVHESHTIFRPYLYPSRCHLRSVRLTTKTLKQTTNMHRKMAKNNSLMLTNSKKQTLVFRELTYPLTPRNSWRWCSFAQVVSPPKCSKDFQKQPPSPRVFQLSPGKNDMFGAQGGSLAVIGGPSYNPNKYRAITQVICL